MRYTLVMRSLLLLPILLLAGCQAAPSVPSDGASSSSTERSALSSVISSESTSSVSSLALSQTYTNSDYNFQLSYPAGFEAKKDFYTDESDLASASILYPDSFAKNVTLIDARVDMTVQAGTCKDTDTFNVQSRQSAVINGITFNRADGSDVGAGNLYDVRSYSTTHNSNCYRSTLIIHSCNLGPDCAAGHQRTFDRKPLQDIFEQMMTTFKFTK